MSERILHENKTFDHGGRLIASKTFIEDRPGLPSRSAVKLAKLRIAARQFLGLCTPDGYPGFVGTNIELWFSEEKAPEFWQAFKALEAELKESSVG